MSTTGQDGTLMKWEYKLLRFDAEAEPVETDEQMNSVGEYHWELVGMMHHCRTGDEPAYYTAVFKRPRS